MASPVTQWQILAKDPDKLSGFYSRLFGWKISADNPLGYRTADTGTQTGIPGGFWPSGPEGHSFVQLFVQVEDVPGTIARLTELGGGVIVPHQVLPGGDEMAIVRDPEGIPFGLTKPAR